MKYVLAYDLGGTKIEVGVVNERGKILAHSREKIDFSSGKKKVLEKLIELGKPLLKEYKIHAVGIASAGPLHAEKGILLDPTNFFTDGKSWGKIAIVDFFSKQLKKKVVLENDAAAAVLAESWMGVAKPYKNILMLTLGTGLGTGIIVDGKLVQAGRGLHTEGGHMVINYLEKDILCGCGNFGCAEAYLSGKNFSKWASTAMHSTQLPAEEIAQLARSGNKLAQEQFSKYSEILAQTICSFVVLYAPDIVVFSGSFSAANDLFLAPTKIRLSELLKRRNKTIKMQPTLSVSTLKNHSGLLGAAKIAFDRH